MMKPLKWLFWRIGPRAPGIAVLGAVLIYVGEAVTLNFQIQKDTYIDSRPANANKNYGAATKVRCVVNSSDASVTRGLFMLPPEIAWYRPEQIVQAVVSFYVWQDNTSNRNVTLYPLMHSFVEGTGNGSIPADGATWFTYDGTNAWTEPGGDCDTNFAVVGVKGPVLDTNLNDRFFYWDITSLLTHEAARSNLLAHGAMLRIDETPIPPTGMPRAPFTSSDDMGSSDEFRPRLQLVVTPQPVDVVSISIMNDTLMVSVTNCTPWVTHRVEYTLDLQGNHAWTFLTNFIVTNEAPQWATPVFTNGPQAFYRVVVAP